MKIRFLIPLVLLAASVLGADKPQFMLQGVGASIIEVKIDVVKEQITWKGRVFLGDKTQKFSATIDPFNAKMTVGKETRYFAPAEAAHSLQHLGWVIRYAAESTVWWKLGMGSTTPVPPQAQPSPRINEPKEEVLGAQ